MVASSCAVPSAFSPVNNSRDSRPLDAPELPLGSVFSSVVFVNVKYGAVVDIAVSVDYIVRVIVPVTFKVPAIV